MKKLFVALMLMPLMALADTEVVDGITWTYTITDGKAQVGAGSSSGPAIPASTVGEITIPSILGGCPVTAIGSGAFSAVSLSSVTIPEGVLSIGSFAFYGCGYLGAVSIPSSVTSIGKSAFQACRCLKSVKIPESMTSIGDSLFLGCVSLKSVTIPSNVTSIGKSAFEGCSGLSSVTIPPNVTDICDSAFLGCSGLRSVTISSGVTNIEKWAFSCCKSLTAFSVDEANLFYSSRNGLLCSKDGKVLVAGMSYYNVSIPSSVTSIGDWAFYGCDGLASVTIPEGVTSIGDSAFYSCGYLTSVTIPSSVLSIGTEAFYGCNKLSMVKVFDLSAWCRIAFSDKYSNPISHSHRLILDDHEIVDLEVPKDVATINKWAFLGCSGLKSATILEGVTSIGWGAFEGCSGLTSVTIPEGVTNIENSAFYGCRGLASVTMPSSVASIGKAAFEGTAFYDNLPDGMVILGGGVLLKYKGMCPSSVTIPEGVTSIGDSAFCHCVELISVTIPEGVTRIGEEAFSGCSGLMELIIPSSVTSIGRSAFYQCCRLNSVIIPPGVRSFGVGVFEDCSGLTSVTISEGVTSIGNSAFRGCSELTSVTIPEGVTSIGGSAFYDCSSLTSVAIPDSVTSIGNSAFRGCSGLTSVTIPSNVTNIGGSAFEYCYRLTSVMLLEGVTDIGGSAFRWCYELASATIPSSVTNIGADAFYDCRGLKAILIPANVASIGDSAFSNCRGLTTAMISEGVVSIGGHAFSDCSGLLSMTIPSSVTSIGGYAFSGCRGLTSVTVLSSFTNIGTHAFDGCDGLSDKNGFVIVNNVLCEYCGDATEVQIPDGVTCIGGGAFDGCSGLTSVTIPEGVTNIENSAFYGCSGLASVMIPPSVTRIGGWTFARCSSMKSVTIPLSVMSIGQSAFDECESLTVVYVGGNDTARVKNLYEWDGQVAIVEVAEYKLSYVDTKDLSNPNPSTYTTTNEIVFTALSDTDEYWFKGWEPAKIEVGTTGDLVVTAKWDRIQGVSEAAGDQNREWVSSGDADWFVAWNDEKGKYVVRSGEIGNSQTSVLETVVMNGGTVSFAVATSCEPSYRGKIRTDGLSFSVDGNEVLWLDSESGWTNVLWSVTGEGAHKLKWKYGKDVEGANGMDCAFLSEFTFYHEVVVNFSGGDAKEGDAPSPIFSYNGAEITLPPLGTLRNPRHAFVGWSDGETVYQPGDRFLLGDVAPVFIAQWAAKRLSAPIISVPPFYTTEKTTVRISAEAGAEVRYTLDGSDPTMTSAAYEGPFEIAGSMTVKAAAFREDWFDSPVVSAATVRAPWTYGECLNSEMLNLASEGAGAWARDLSVTHDGAAALCSGAIGNNATSRLELVVVGAGELIFWWKASTEVYRGIPMDSGVLVVDGEDVAEIYGEADWARKAVVLTGSGRHTIRWEFRKDEEDDPLAVGDDCVWLDEVKWTSFTPSVVNDEGATVTGDAETGFVIKPSEGTMVVEVTIPQGVDAAKVTVAVSVKVESVKSNGAKVKIVSGDADITEFLDVPAADGNGVVDLTKATVKEEIVKEVFDSKKGAKIELNAANPKLATAPTRTGLFYQLREGELLDGMKDGDSTIGNGQPWSPEITIKGGNSAFYSIGVGKGE